MYKQITEPWAISNLLSHVKTTTPVECAMNYANMRWRIPQPPEYQPFNIQCKIKRNERENKTTIGAAHLKLICLFVSFT